MKNEKKKETRENHNSISQVNATEMKKKVPRLGGMGNAEWRLQKEGL